jgi:DNA-binding YbaB/EbfC family protein
MFDQLKAMKSLAGLMGNAGDLKAKFDAIQQELEAKTVEGDAGQGAVRVTVNGKLQVVAVQLDPAVLALFNTADDASDADRQQLENLIAQATNHALDNAQTMIRDEMSAITGGLGLPGM